MANAYTIDQIREATRRRAEGQPEPDDADPELEKLVRELAKSAGTIYRITDSDLYAYLQQREGEHPCEKRMPVFQELVRAYINRCDALGEQLGICLDLAYGDAAETPCNCPAHGEEAC